VVLRGLRIPVRRFDLFIRARISGRRIVFAQPLRQLRTVRRSPPRRVTLYFRRIATRNNLIVSDDFQCFFLRLSSDDFSSVSSCSVSLAQRSHRSASRFQVCWFSLCGARWAMTWHSVANFRNRSAACIGGSVCRISDSTAQNQNRSSRTSWSQLGSCDAGAMPWRRRGKWATSRAYLRQSIASASSCRQRGQAHLGHLRVIGGARDPGFDAKCRQLRAARFLD
jgi:hypothetical protein